MEAVFFFSRNGYWNNIGRYDDVRPDVGDEDPYPWGVAEAANSTRKPALTGVFSQETEVVAEQVAPSAKVPDQSAQIPAGTAGVGGV